MDILITGRLASLTEELHAPLTQNHRVVIASDDLTGEHHGKNVTPFCIAPRDEEFERIFHSHTFGAVLFFAQPLYEKQAYYEEYQDLENCLRLCAKHDVGQVLYLQPYLLDGEMPDSDLGMLFSAANQLCEYYRKRRALSVIRVQLPCLFGSGESVSVIGDALWQARNRASIQFRASETQHAGFLAQRDLGELLLRMVESWPSAYGTIEVPAASEMSFQELGEQFRILFPTLRLSYAHGSPATAMRAQTDIPRKEFDWIPLLRVEEELPQLNHALEDAPVEERVSPLQRLGAWIKRHAFVVRLAELLLGFLLMEFLNRITSTTIQFQYVDFRLVYVVLMGTIHGMKTGIAAAALASVSLLVASIGGQGNWSVMVYDIDTWLPFIFFFLVGTVTGYVKDRLRNDNAFLTEEKTILEDKYIQLSEFYASALQNKEQYKTQIMSYRDSFGRLFDITKSLDSTLVDEVFSEALNALEGVLDNKSVCIYSCDEKLLFGRLIVCSKEIRGVTEKSMMLSRLPVMTSAFCDGEVWVNRERLLGYPEYAVPLYRDDKPIALIVLQKVKFEQMAIYYENLVKIICGLVKISLIRAIEYREQTEDEMYLPDSHIMAPEYFRQVIEVKEEMAENGVAEYVLIRFSTTPQDRIHVGNQLSRLLRVTDILGLGPDGELYLCLAQTNQDTIQVVLDRIRKSGLVFSETEYGDAS